MALVVSGVIDRSVDVVWRFVAVEHLRNHPRWDPKMQLRLLTPGPFGAGSRVARRHTRMATPIEGEMQVVDWQPPRTMGVVIHDQTPSGPLEVRSRVELEPVGSDQTRLTIALEMAGRDSSMDPTMVQASLSKMKELIESET